MASRKAPRSGRAIFFVKGAYLYTLPREPSEEEFVTIAASGIRGMDYLMQFQNFPFVSLVLDDPQNPFLVGHTNGRTIALAMSGHDKWQTMEWK